MKTVNLLRETNNQEAAILDFYLESIVELDHCGTSEDTSSWWSKRDLNLDALEHGFTCARPFITQNFIRQKMSKNEVQTKKIHSQVGTIKTL